MKENRYKTLWDFTVSFHILHTVSGVAVTNISLWQKMEQFTQESEAKVYSKAWQTGTKGIPMAGGPDLVEILISKESHWSRCLHRNQLDFLSFWGIVRNLFFCTPWLSTSHTPPTAGLQPVVTGKVSLRRMTNSACVSWERSIEEAGICSWFFGRPPDYWKALAVQISHGVKPLWFSSSIGWWSF